MTARWNFNYSPSERKTINGTTFYKVAIGKETRWLSMSGIKMLNNARQAGVNQKTALKASSYYTGQGTRIRIGKMRPSSHRGGLQKDKQRRGSGSHSRRGNLG
jgi:hypothetical protein